MPDALPVARCPVAARPCPELAACAVPLPPQDSERAAILILRFLAAARETGDACCWDAALDQAEAVFGEHRGPLVVGQAGALIRRLARAGAGIAFLPPPCRRLSSGEALLLGALRTRPPGPLLHVDAGPLGEHVAALAQSIASADIDRKRQAA